MPSTPQGKFPGFSVGGDPVENLWAIYEAYWEFPDKRSWCRRQVEKGSKDVPKSRLDTLQKEISELEKEYGTYEIILSKTLPPAVEERALVRLEGNILRYIFIRDLVFFITEGK